MTAEPRSVCVCAQPDKEGFAHDVVFWNEAPIARVGRTMAIVALHPVIVHLEGVLRSFLSVDEDVAFVSYLQVVALINTDGTLVDGDVVQRQLDAFAFLGNPNWPVVVLCPTCISILRIEPQVATLNGSDAFHIFCMSLQSLLCFGSQGNLACLVHFLDILHTQAEFIDEVFWEIARLEFNVVIELHILGRRVLLAIQIDYLISYLERLSGESDATLHIVLTTVNRTPTHFSEVLRVKSNVLTS